MNEQEFAEIKQFIDGDDTFAVVSHISPDGDTIGSALAVVWALRRLGKTVTVHDKDAPIPSFAFLPGIEEYQTLEYIPGDAAIICVDCADLRRTGLDDVNGRRVLNLDHHISNTRFGTVNYVSQQAATCEIIFDFIQRLGVSLDERICPCLYTGITTDTSNFTNSNVTSHTFLSAAALLTAGLEPAPIAKAIFRTRSKAQTKAIALVIDHMQFFLADKVAVTYLTAEELEQLHLLETDGLVDYTCDVEGVEVGVFLKETPDGKIKASFRSNGKVDVRQVCQQFGGGGHVRAAGCLFSGKLEEVIQKLVAEVGQWMA